MGVWATLEVWQQVSIFPCTMINWNLFNNLTYVFRCQRFFPKSCLNFFLCIRPLSFVNFRLKLQPEYSGPFPLTGLSYYVFYLMPKFEKKSKRLCIPDMKTVKKASVTTSESSLWNCFKGASKRIKNEYVRARRNISKDAMHNVKIF